MSISLSQTYTAIGPGLTAYFLGAGGTPPYSYSVIPAGAGGSINSSSGLYTGPSQYSLSPNQAYDVIQVTDAVAAQTSASILIGSPLSLFADIIQTYLGLDNNHCYFFDQKIFQPTDSGLYVVISIESCKPFGNTSQQVSSGSLLNEVQNVNMYSLLGLDIISRGPAARDQKELVIAALNSTYAEQQQEKNSFYIGRISTQFTNLSGVDGAAIPYRFHISVAFQYTVSKTIPIPYFDQFTDTIATNP